MKPKSLLDEDKPAVQLTSRQLLTGICGGLLLALAFFVAGYMLRSYEISLREKRAQVVPQPAAQTPGKGVPAATSSGEGRQVSPRQDLLGPGAKVPGPIERTPINRTDLPRIVPIGPTPAATGATPATGTPMPPMRTPSLPVAPTQPQSPTVQPVSKTPEPSGAALPSSGSLPAPVPGPAGSIPTAPLPAPSMPTEPKPSEQAKSPEQPKPGEQAPKPAPTPLEPIKVVEHPGPAAASPSPSGLQKPADPAGLAKTQAPPPQPEEGAVPPPAADKGTFAIQAVAFQTKDNAKAEQAKTKSAAASGLSARIVTSEDGKHLRILLGSFPNRPAAQKACDDLRKREEFKDCFVKAF